MSSSISPFTLADYDKAYGSNIDGIGTRSFDKARYAMRLDDTLTSTQKNLAARRAAVRRFSGDVASGDTAFGRRAALVGVNDAVSSEDAAFITILTSVFPSEESLGSAETLNWFRMSYLDSIETGAGSSEIQMDLVTVFPLVVDGEVSLSDEFDSVRRRMVSFSEEAALNSDAVPFFRFGMGSCAGDVISDESFGYENRRPIEAIPEDAIFQEDELLLFYAGREWGIADLEPVTAWSRQAEDTSAWERAAEKTTQWAHTPGVREVMPEERL